LERILESGRNLIEVLSGHLHKETEKNHGKQQSWYSGRDLNQASPEYKPSPLSLLQLVRLLHLLCARITDDIGTNFMELSPFSLSASCGAAQELPNILRNPKVHYRVHKSRSLFSILSQISLFHTIPFYLSKVYLILLRVESLLCNDGEISEYTKAVSRQRFNKQVPVTSDTNAAMVQQQRNAVSSVVRAEKL
jgi:hypothetical protein